MGWAIDDQIASYLLAVRKVGHRCFGFVDQPGPKKSWISEATWLASRDTQDAKAVHRKAMYERRIALLRVFVLSWSGAVQTAVGSSSWVPTSGREPPRPQANFGQALVALSPHGDLFRSSHAHASLYQAVGGRRVSL